jgi:DNA polymerase III alpha subunit (gram-positive type)
MLEFLDSCGVDKDIAFKFAELVRKGKQKDPKFPPLIEKLKECNVPE